MNFLAVLFFIASVVVNTHSSSVLNLNKLSYAPPSDKKVLSATDPSSLPSDDIADTEEIPQSISPSAALAQYNSDAQKVDALPTTSVDSTITKPNVVVIMIDDINPVDGRLFTKKTTPYIYNNIIAKGVNFTNFYGETSLCCPGRVGFLTGQHTHNHGVLINDATLFNPTESLATELQGVGYTTILTGKYLNNFPAIPVAKAVPPGWSKFDAIYETNGEYYNYRFIHKDRTIDKYAKAPADYSTDVIANQNIIRLKAAPKNQPIFDYVAPYAIHGNGQDSSTNLIRPTTPAPRDIGDSRCKNIGKFVPPNFNEKDMSDKPAYEKAWPKLPISGYSLVKPCESLIAVDDMVGRIVKTLKQQNRYNNTMFILMGDNGMGWGEHRMESKGEPFTTQVPVYISWPTGRGSAPRTENTTLSNIDFAPTICEMAGCVMGPYPNGQDIADGLSFLPLIENQSLSWSRDAIVEEGSVGPIRWFAARTTSQSPLGIWHFVENSTGEKELYNLSGGSCDSWKVGKPGDPCEMNNLLGPNASITDYILTIANNLHDRLAALKAEKGSTKPATIPTPTPTFTPTPTAMPTPTPTQVPGPTSLKKPAVVKILSLNLTTSADAYVRSDIPVSNFGGNTQLRADGSPAYVSFLKFDLSKLKGKTVISALLKLKVSYESDAGSSLGQGLSIQFVSNNAWSESAITFNNKPASLSTITTVTGAKAAGDTIEIDLTSFVNQKAGQLISIELSNTGPDGLVLNSRQASSGKPTLAVSYK